MKPDDFSPMVSTRSIAYLRIVFLTMLIGDLSTPCRRIWHHYKNLIGCVFSIFGNGALQLEVDGYWSVHRWTDVFRIDKHGLNTLLDVPLKKLMTHGLSAITHQLYSSRSTPFKFENVLLSQSSKLILWFHRSWARHWIVLHQLTPCRINAPRNCRGSYRIFLLKQSANNWRPLTEG